MEPGTKIAVISKSAIKEDKPRAKIEASPAVKKPKARPPPPPKRTATELILPPKEREERVSLFICCLHPNDMLRIF